MDNQLHTKIKSVLLKENYGPSGTCHTAPEAYNEYVSEARKHLDKINKILSYNEQKPSTEADWGDVGSMALLHDNLKEIVDHYGV